MITYLVFTNLLGVLIHAAPILIDPKIDDLSLKKLRLFGYLQEDESANTVSSLHNPQSIINAIKHFQRFANLNQTGVIDEATQKMIISPRCGVADVETSVHRQKRFARQGTKWQNNPVTWKLENANNDGLTQSQIRELMKRSFAKWSNAANIDFVETPNVADGASQIRVRFEQGVHADNFPFDGPSGTLAHAFFPLSNQGLSGDIHFDDAEKYTTLDLPQNSGTIKFLWVAVHELGHSVGLSHSDLRGTVMYPWYLHFPGNDFDLKNDDIAGIQSIYGKRPVTTKSTTTTATTTKLSTNNLISTKTTTTTTTTTKKPNSCITTIKSVLLASNKKSYIFNDDALYEVGIDGNGVDTVRTTQQVFNGIPFVDAVHRRQGDGNIAFFHGDTFSVYTETGRLVTAARKISDGYQGLPDGFRDIDAALLWSTNQKVYIFKGEEYWRFTKLTASQDYLLDFNYPLEIRNRWIGVPNSIDAAFTWSNGQTYFFKGDKYYRYDKLKSGVSFGYPLEITRTFLKCDTTSNLLENLNNASSGNNLKLALPAVGLIIFAHLLLQTISIFSL